MTHSENSGSHRFEGYVTSIETIVIESDSELKHWFPRRPQRADQSDTAAEWMAPELHEAWQYVQRDLVAADAIVPALSESNWTDDSVLVEAAAWWPDGSGVGIGVPWREPLPERVAFLADRVQDAEVEALWSAGRSAVWPRCPKHPNSHPLRAEVRDGVAVWTCTDSEVIAPIGELG